VASAEPDERRLALIVKSDSYEDLLLAISLAGIAASAGQAVVMFFTNRGARRLKRGGLDDIEETDAIGREFIDGAKLIGFRDVGGMLAELKATGRVRLYLCSRGARIWDIDADAMLPEVDSIMGTATFLLEEVPRAHSVITV